MSRIFSLPVLVHPYPPAPQVEDALQLAGQRHRALAGAQLGTLAEWSGAVISADAGLADSIETCRSLRDHGFGGPILLIAGSGELDRLADLAGLFDDFCLAAARPLELATRLRRLAAGSEGAGPAAVLEYGDIVLDLDAYAVTVAGRPLALTRLEFALLKFFITHPHKVFTRESLLAAVWDYEWYFGDGRTVDVHVRRLRHKLGTGHFDWIQTVRNVGYGFCLGGRAEPAARAG